MPLIAGIQNSAHILVCIQADFQCNLADTNKLPDHLFPDIDYWGHKATDDMDLCLRREWLKKLNVHYIRC